MEKPVYHRVLLKISGEALAGDKHSGLDFEVIGQVCDVIKKCLDMGVQVGVVVGGGNFWRGVKGADPCRSHRYAGYGHELPGSGGRLRAEGHPRPGADRH